MLLILLLHRFMTFFHLLRSQQPNFFVGEFLKHFLPKQWNFFSHTLIHIFTSKTTNLHGITLFLRKIGYAIAHNMHVNFGLMLLEYMLVSIGDLEDRTIPPNDVTCFFPRFLHLILNDLLIDDEKDSFSESEIDKCKEMKKNVITQLINRAPYHLLPMVLTPYLSTLSLPLQPLDHQQPGIV